MYPSRLLTSLLAVWLILGGGNGWCAAGETTLTYQGRLDSAGRPANGLYQMRFSVWTAATGGTSPTGVLGPCDVPVASGLFQEAVPVPDVPGLWTGEPRWLEVAVKPAAAPDSAFVTLAPRQLITRVPMAGYADAAARLTSPLTAAQLPGAAARLDLSQTFTGTPSFQPPSGAPFAVGSTSRVDRLNADLLDGRDATSFWERKVVDGAATLGEAGDTPIELRLWNGNYGVLRLDRGVLSPSLTYSLVPNSVATGLSSVVYLGGGERARPNRVEADFATILNGRANLIQSNAQFSGILASDNSSIGAKARNSVIAGGVGLRIEADSLFSGLFGGFGNVIRTNAGSAGMLAGNGNEIGTGAHFAGLLGGEQNTVEGGAQRAVILGGRYNTIEARAEESAILGGYGNRVSSNATHAVVVGGDRNYAAKQFTLAAGRQAQANHLGAFVWSDSEAGAGPFASQRDNEFAVKATGGARFETKGAGLWVDGQRFLPPGGPGDLPDGSILAAKLADGAVLMELTDDDGAGSGLDADLLDGKQATQFAEADHGHLGETWIGLHNPLTITGFFGGLPPTNAAVVLANAAGDGLRIQEATDDGIEIKTAGGDGVAIASAGRHAVFITESTDNGVNVVHAGRHGLAVAAADGDGIQIDAAAGNGIDIDSAGGHGVHVAAAQRHGVMASTTSASQYGGWFGNSHTNGAGLYARSGSGGIPDLILGANGDANRRSKAGAIASDPTAPDSWMQWLSNGGVEVVLDQDQSLSANDSAKFSIQLGWPWPVDLFEVYGYPNDQVPNSLTAVRGELEVDGGAQVYGYFFVNDDAHIDGHLQVSSGLDVLGSKSAVVDTESAGRRRLYSVESPENWFEDFGTANLTNGLAQVLIEPIYAQTVNLSQPYHVFVTPLGDGQLFVAEKTSTAFTVRAVGGQPAHFAFDYRIVAKRRAYETVRLEIVESPPAPPARFSRSNRGSGPSLTSQATRPQPTGAKP